MVNNVPFMDLKRQYSVLKKDILDSISSIIDDTSFINGKNVKNFELEIEEYLNVKHCISCSNGTDALVLALRACNVKPGDEVITTSFSFFATAEAIAAVGAIPVFVDVDLNNYNIDASLIENKITDKTVAILPVHIFGAPCDITTICNIAKKHNLKVIDDCAQAIGSKIDNKYIGGFADISCFSFYPTKNLGGAGDGGMLTTNSDDLNTIARSLKEHGAGELGLKSYKLLTSDNSIELPSNEKSTDLYNPYKYYNFLIGYNYRLDSFQAAVLSIKLKHLNEYNEKRRKIADFYNMNLDDRIIKPKYNKNTISCYHQYVVRSSEKFELMNYLTNNGVGNGAFYPVPLHKQKAFSKFGTNSITLQNAELLSKQTVCLPIFPEMTLEEMEFVVNKVNSFFKR